MTLYVFNTPFDQYDQHNGLCCEIISDNKECCDFVYDETGAVLVEIKLENGGIIQAFPIELNQQPQPDQKQKDKRQ